MSRATYTRLAADWLPGHAIPDHPEFGARYPWRRVATHALSSQHRRRVAAALRVLDRAAELGLDFRLTVSAGKDSTALALLCGEHGWVRRGLSVKDDLDYPGELEYIAQLRKACGVDIEILAPETSLLAFLRAERVSLVDDLHSRAAELSAQHFYGLLDGYQDREGYDGVVWGVRAGESHGRRMRRLVSGTLYRRKHDGLHICQPLADWTALDVHAFCAARGVPLLPVYLCLDPGMEPLSIRKSWWVSGGYSASIGGHYVWLRRWWPELWEKAVSVDPAVARIS